jgi:hypothetical protein
LSITNPSICDIFNKKESTLMTKTIGKILWIVAIIFMGLTAVMNLLGGTGTVCAAFLTANFPSMAELMDYRWLYQLLMIVTVVIGVANVWVLIGLIRKREKSYRNALIVLVAGTIVAGIQVYASLALRGKAVPANIKLYTNAITLLLFLILKAPGIREWIDFTAPASSTEEATTAGMVTIVSGMVILTVFSWAGSSHTYMGENWVEVLRTPLILSGGVLLLSGLGFLIHALRQVLQHEVTEATAEA